MIVSFVFFFFFFSSRRRHTRCSRDWSSDVCSSDLVDMKQVLDAAASHGKIVEINANPHRLDLDWRLCGYAKEKGVRFSINPDAHSTEGLADVPFGVNVARKGGGTAQDVVKTLPVEAITASLQAISSRAIKV